MSPPTIVSLIASATEIICALGLRDRLVGISHECDYPDDVRSLPALSVPKVDPKADSSAIDQAVRDIVSGGLSVYDIHHDLLAQIQPGLIVTQDHCEVCAVSLKDVEEATCAITMTDTQICSLHPNTLDDVFEDIQKVADAAGVSDRGYALVAQLNERFDALRIRSAGLPSRPRIACVEWIDPPMVAGGWMPTLVEMAGGESVLVHAGEAFQTVTWDTIVDADPDVVAVLPCGFPIAQTVDELVRTPALVDQLQRIPTVQVGRVFIVDGNAYFNRPGPRLVESAEILAALIHPDHFPDLANTHRDAIRALSDIL